MFYRVKRQLCRSGIGMKLDPTNMNEFKKKCEEALNKFVQECSLNDHLALADLSHDERRIMHEYVTLLFPHINHKLIIIILKI